MSAYCRLTDLRLLKVAALLEKTLEEYELFLRSLVPFLPVRERLEPLFSDGPGHAELKRLLAQFEESVTASAELDDPAQTLHAILGCENFAHDFYISMLDKPSDPRVVRVFRQLADEKGHHVEHVGAAIRLLGGLPMPRTGRVKE